MTSKKVFFQKMSITFSIKQMCVLRLKMCLLSIKKVCILKLTSNLLAEKRTFVATCGCRVLGWKSCQKAGAIASQNVSNSKSWFTSSPVTGKNTILSHFKIKMTLKLCQTCRRPSTDECLFFQRCDSKQKCFQNWCLFLLLTIKKIRQLKLIH